MGAGIAVRIALIRVAGAIQEGVGIGRRGRGSQYTLSEPSRTRFSPSPPDELRALKGPRAGGPALTRAGTRSDLQMPQKPLIKSGKKAQKAPPSKKRLAAQKAKTKKGERLLSAATIS